ncbi:adenine phosphoribosyltransferase [Hydrogenibacillus sp. N12]|uniref:adenine phosphoribosyltransferase n=1 Tax=Hydrogenibacillus sp. N12 TaxID=2866627 RepID=UPI001C7D9EB1|nr:adenine phosphoribosyltransferase [Hydrogenibacillus sp. N12]QZA33888.1 adenine phosphoribosyltransferase [Hydrogenibacillus sp. N12]
MDFDFKRLIRVIPDFPQPGILFKDITTLLKDGRAFRAAIDALVEAVRPLRPEVIVGPEARGFAIGAPIAYALGVGFVPVRKPGKLPAETVSVTYEKEYGPDDLAVHRDAFPPGTRVLVADDLLATGGTIGATVDLVHRLDGEVVGAVFLIELTYLGGRAALEQKIAPAPIVTLIRF